MTTRIQKLSRSRFFESPRRPEAVFQPCTQTDCIRRFLKLIHQKIASLIRLRLITQAVIIRICRMRIGVKLGLAGIIQRILIIITIRLQHPDRFIVFEFPTITEQVSIGIVIIITDPVPGCRKRKWLRVTSSYFNFIPIRNAIPIEISVFGIISRNIRVSESKK